MPINPETLQRLKQSEEEFTQKLVKDIRTVFNTMVGVEDLMHLPIQVDLARDFEDCITALVGMAGTLNGLVSVHVPSGLAKSLTAQMLGMEVEEIDQDVYDALGEIANMIAGSFKQHFSKGGADISISLPSIVYGADYSFNTGGPASENVTLKFASDEEWFMVALTIEN